MKTIRTTIITAFFATRLLSAVPLSASPDDLYTTEGTDFTIEELV